MIVLGAIRAALSLIIRETIAPVDSLLIEQGLLLHLLLLLGHQLFYLVLSYVNVRLNPHSEVYPLVDVQEDGQ